ncbi:MULTISPECIES: helix-turn-helix transcriptional regulator [Thioclava]|uniref:Helix-turn-helix transcriptional regulator n=1 Tax=Thioclava litoralis TaxID=3076557 RepID=A0ABZ1E6I5_9RHOB|nr:helix-turn-helix transcriptional regulator [Thioclava sp. FTW29]
MSQDLPRNLRLLCSYHASIVAVCQQLGVNRSQFNRYLTGETFPSLRSMRRICDFFGVEEAELLLAHGQFVELVRLRPQSTGVRAERDIVSLTAGELRMQSAKALVPYLGYYLTWYNSMSHPGQVLCALSKLYDTPFGVNVKSVESVGRPGARKFTCKYEGACFLLGDRLFMTVMETLTRNEVMQIILYPSYNNRIRYLGGVVSGVAARAPRPPSATQMVMEYLGKSVDLRAMMRRCSLYSPQDPRIPEEVRQMLSGGLRAGSQLVEAPVV